MRRFLLTLLSLFGILWMQAQEVNFITKDSLVSAELIVLNEMQYNSVDYSEIFVTYDQLLQHNDLSKDDRLEIQIHFIRYLNGMGKHSTETFKALFNELVEGAKDENLNPELKEILLYTIGSTRLIESNYSEALSYLNRSLEASKSLQDSSRVVKNCGMLIRVYEELDDMPKLKAVLIDMENYIPYGDHLAQGYFHLKQYDLLKLYSIEERASFLMQAKLHLEAQPKTNFHHVLYSSLAQYHLNTNQLDSSRYYLEKLEVLFENTPEYKLKYDRLNLVSLKALNFFFGGEYDAAIEEFETAIDMCRQFNIPIQRRTLLEIMIQVSSSEEDFKKAFEYQSQLKSLNDSLLSHERIAEYEDLIVKYETEKKEQTIANLQQQETLNELVIEKQRSSNILLIILSVFLALLVILSVIFYLQKKKDSEELNSLNILKDQIFSILTHDLRSPLYSFDSLIKLAKRNFLSQEEFSGYVDTLQNEIQSASMLMESLLKWAQTNQKEIVPVWTEVNPSQLIQESLSLFTDLTQSKSLEIETDMDTDLMVNSDKDLLSFILRNILHNAIKFSPKQNKVSIVIQEESKITSIVIKNHGPEIKPQQISAFNKGILKAGIDPQGNKSTGLGLSLCKQLADLLGHDIHMESTQGTNSIIIKIKRGA